MTTPEEPEIDNIRAVARQATWIADIETPEAVEIFLRHYYVEHYGLMANYVENILKEELKNGGVKQFRLSSRGKDKKSLKEKLIVRNVKKRYKHEDDIIKDVLDLAGVRIILYMPTPEEYKRVERVIQKRWGKDLKPKTHPESPEEEKENDKEENKHENDGEDKTWNKEEGKTKMKKKKKQKKDKGKYQPRHLGYRAIHYRVPMEMEKEKGDGRYDVRENDVVEIQVVSALTHAWAEVGHDILYKSYVYGPPTFQEQRTLDSLNGLIHSGDLLLEQFQEMLEKRTTTSFKHEAELTVYLHDFFQTERDLLEEEDEEDEEEDEEDDEQAKEEKQEPQSATFPCGDGVYILYKFLENEGKNCPYEVRKVLKQLKYPYKHEQAEQRIKQETKGKPQLAADMSMVVCVIRTLLIGKSYQPAQKHIDTRAQCSLMISALTMLQYSLGSVPLANKYLEDAKLNEEQIKSINFILENPKCYTILKGGKDKEEYKLSLADAWNWFRNEARNPNSICGLLFRLAEMGCWKVDPSNQLTRLQIDLVCSSTANMDNAPTEL